MLQRVIVLAVVVISHAGAVRAADEQPSPDTSRGDALVAEYFRRETERLERATLAGIDSLEDWTARRDEYRRQLREMLGLDPLPERTPLEAVTTGTVDHPEFTVEKLHFQSLPGLYVTANLYVPRKLDGKAPAILYVCGHAQVREGERSMGNKTGYQHHGAWFARHGYVCLTIDTLQLGEIEGIHHGTYRYGRWWWNSRGYTPAGVEAWNGIRALDYLESRPEVDAERIGVTGRSGGGAYSWWIAALDDRIQCAVPVAGITSLRNHVVDGTVAGHCDCMFMVNTYGWDFPLVAALVAPRPLLISNTDKDSIFPLDGVIDVHAKVRQIYRLYDAEQNLGLQITEGPHEDTQELHIHAFVWMNRFLKKEDPPIDLPAAKLFEPKQLRVFEELPEDERNTSIDETFVPEAVIPEPPETAEDWSAQRERWLADLRAKCFRAWPADAANDALTLDVAERERSGAGDLRVSLYEFTSQRPYRLPMIAVQRGESTERVHLQVVDQAGWERHAAAWGTLFPQAVLGVRPIEFAEAQQQLAELDVPTGTLLLIVPPRGVGPTEWSRDERTRTQIRRRFMLLGQTDHSARVYDVRRAVQAARQIAGAEAPLTLSGERDASVWVLYASLFEPGIAEIVLHEMPASHRDGPDLLNVLRILDIPQTVAMAAERCAVKLQGAQSTSDVARQPWGYAQAVAERLGWEGRLTTGQTP